MIPRDLSERYEEWHWELAYHWNPGLPTYRLTRGGETRFVKVHPVGSGIPDEANRLRWALSHYPVPELIEYGSDGDVDWLMTGALPGVDATRVNLEPSQIAVAFGEGLRRFHDAVPPDECPFWSSSADRVVVCHGDYTLPNVMMIDGRVSGYLDLGALNVADPETDFEIALTSIRFNLGDGYGDLFLAGYGR